MWGSVEYYLLESSKLSLSQAASPLNDLEFYNTY